MIPTPTKAEEVEVNPFYGPPLERQDPIITDDEPSESVGGGETTTL